MEEQNSTGNECLKWLSSLEVDERKTKYSRVCGVLTLKIGTEALAACKWARLWERKHWNQSLKKCESKFSSNAVRKTIIILLNILYMWLFFFFTWSFRISLISQISKIPQGWPCCWAPIPIKSSAWGLLQSDCWWLSVLVMFFVFVIYILTSPICLSVLSGTPFCWIPRLNL